ncbi:hypothetical protein DES53_1011062 [Roseimicrobium gellanilyticum]|uniref:Uncharacterized protein n=1 Tax=Roseimicrobium gellanilyticum TaxID=748857 RepID=A0A366HWH8_9BACT|nr:hypothetical protein DES53_1011062 [Roseimicrobium gellanilyticum]
MLTRLAKIQPLNCLLTALTLWVVGTIGVTSTPVSFPSVGDAIKWHLEHQMFYTIFAIGAVGFILLGIVNWVRNLRRR